jgi:hypothetical protein
MIRDAQTIIGETVRENLHKSTQMKPMNWFVGENKYS